MNPLVRVTLVPTDTELTNVGPFDCLEFRAMPTVFHYTQADGTAGEPVNMVDRPYTAIGEYVEADGAPPAPTSLDAWEECLAAALPPSEHAQVVICKDSTIATFVGPHALVLSQMFLGAVKDEGLT